MNSRGNQSNVKIHSQYMVSKNLSQDAHTYQNPCIYFFMLDILRGNISTEFQNVKSHIHKFDVLYSFVHV